MALFELKQDTGSGAAAPWAPPTFKDCVAADIDAAFFEENEHADRHTVDGKDVLIVLEDDDLREHSAHWEAGAKQNFDTGLSSKALPLTTAPSLRRRRSWNALASTSTCPGRKCISATRIPLGSEAPTRIPTA